MKFHIALLVLLFMITPTIAQEDSVWCEIAPVEDAEITPLTVANDLPILSDIFGFDEDVYYVIPYQNFILTSDETFAITGILLGDNPPLADYYGVDLETERIIYRLSMEDIVALRPIHEDNNFTEAYLTYAEWLGTSRRLLIRTADYCPNCGELHPIPDDLHVIEPDGSITTLLQSRLWVRVLPSPAGDFILIGDRTQLDLMTSDGRETITDIIPNYLATVAPTGTPRLTAFWENNDSALVVGHRGTYKEITTTIDLWRVYTDERESELIRSFIGVFHSLHFSSNKRYLLYPRGADTLQRLDFNAIVQDVATGEEWDLGEIFNEWDVRWVRNIDQPVVRLIDSSESVRFFGLCDNES